MRSRATSALSQKRFDHLRVAWTLPLEFAHGRIEYRELRIAESDLDTSPFPRARQVPSITRHNQHKHCGEYEEKTRHFILSIKEGRVTNARLAQIGRDLWSAVNKNHWRRDSTRWREDRSARRKPKSASNLSLLRGAILALIPPEKFSSLNAEFDQYIKRRAVALHLLTQTAPHQCPTLTSRHPDFRLT